MVYLSLLLMLTLLSSTDGGTVAPSEALNQTTQVIRQLSRRETPVLPSPYLHLPVFVDSRMPLVEKEQFSPSRGTGHETLPEPVREILLPVRPKTSPPNVSGVSVKTSCKPRKMLVQVHKNILSTDEPYSHVKLGTCLANKSTTHYLYFEHDLGSCGIKRAVSSNNSSNHKQYFTNAGDYWSSMYPQANSLANDFSKAVHEVMFGSRLLCFTVFNIEAF